MATTEYKIDEVFEGTCTFKDRLGALADPDTVTARVKLPSGAIVDYDTTDPELTHPSLGVFVLRFRLDAQGRWEAFVRGSSADLADGVNATTSTIAVFVKPEPF